ncbi:conserved hypothetical protein [Mucor ambiguus]|uniref:Uncharacterized protein n=1 Tax=Mucor ambiguus TaxID=91626 RepID=A0A0C9MTM3_9FUNG|nr:conserved hypothetical protein [Mucor ambiguus]
MPINESFFGFIESTTDALLVFEACRRGNLPKVGRRLQDRERGSIKSGTVFVFDEKESGIKRWTDGLVWSPSRILGNFLIYRELDGRESLYQHNRVPLDYEPTHYSSPYDFGVTRNESMQPVVGELSNEERNRERNLVGSLTDTYKFRKGGLIKKTISIHLNGSTQHMISYYTRSDVLEGRLATPSSVSDLSDLQISPDLLLKQSFRVPPSVEFAESLLKRPSLSPTSTNSTTSTATVSTAIRRKFSQATIGNHSLYENYPATRIPNEELPPLSLDHSRRSSFESGANSRKYARTSLDDHQYRRSSLFSPFTTNAQSSATDKILSFPPLPPPPRPPHFLHQYHHQAAPASTMNDMHPRISSGSNTSSSSKLPFDIPDLFPSNNNRLLDQQQHQKYQQPLVSSDALTKSLYRQDVQDTPFRFHKHYDISSAPLSSLSEREHGPSLPSPSSLIWSSTIATNNANAHHPLQQQQPRKDCNSTKMPYYQRPSPPPLSQPNTTVTSPLSIEPASSYNSPTSTYQQHSHYHYERQYNASPSASIHQQLFSLSASGKHL